MRHIQLDNLDDRRELIILLGKLAPTKRVEFVNQAAASVQQHKSVRTIVSRKIKKLVKAANASDEADGRLTLELYFDLWMLAVQHGLDLSRCVFCLEQTVSCRTP